MVAQFRFTKTIESYTFNLKTNELRTVKMLNFMLYESYLNKKIQKVGSLYKVAHSQEQLCK